MSKSETRMSDDVNDRQEINRLLSIHLGFSKHKEGFEPVSEHHDTILTTSPAHRQGLAVISSKGRVRPDSSVVRKLRWRQEDLWPGAREIPIAPAYGHLQEAWGLEDTYRILGWGGTALGGPHVPSARIDALERVCMRLAARVAQLEMRNALVEWQVHVGRPEAVGHTHVDLLSELENQSGTIERCFLNAFGVHATVNIGMSRDDGFALQVTLDASSAEPERVSNARKSGARATFYHNVVDALPAHLVDHVTFEFVFPPDAAE